jgi:hypothetical protein
VREVKNPVKVHTDQEQTNDPDEIQNQQKQSPHNYTWEFFQKRQWKGQNRADIQGNWLNRVAPPYNIRGKPRRMNRRTYNSYVLAQDGQQVAGYLGNQVMM